MKLSIRTKLLSAYFILSLFFLLASASAFINARSLQGVSTENAASLDTLMEAGALCRGLRSQVPMLIRYMDANDTDERNSFINNWNDFEVKLAELRKKTTDSERNSHLDKIKPLQKKINKEMNTLFVTSLSSKQANFQASNIEQDLELIVTYLYDFRDISEQSINENINTINSLSSINRNFAISIIGMVILWFGATFITSRIVTAPLSKLHREVKSISAGNLERRISIKTGDEIEELAEDFNDMFDSIREEQLTAATLQEKLLPPKRIRVKGIKIHAHQVQAKVVGGDWYDYYHSNNSVSFLIADASGKGMAGALVATLTMSSLRSEVKNLETIGMVLRKTNRTIESRLGSGNFSTMFYANLSLETHELTYINCGHELPFWYKAETDTWEFLQSRSSLPLGISTEHFHPRKEKIQLSKGDKLLLYTDGLHDVRNPKRHFFGLEAITTWLNSQDNITINELIDNLLEKALAYGENVIPDDITLLGLEVISDPARKSSGEISNDHLRAIVDGEEVVT